MTTKRSPRPATATTATATALTGTTATTATAASTGTTASTGTRTAVAAAFLAAGLLLTGCTLGPAAGIGGGREKTASADAAITEAVTRIDVSDARSGDIEVTPGAGPGVTVHRTVRYRGGAAPVPAHQVSGGVLSLTNGDCSRRCSIDYRLEVPASATVRLESSSGDIRVTGVAAAEVKTSSGSVGADRIAGPLKVRTSSGTVTAVNLAGPSAEARSSSGDVRLAFTKAPDSVAVETSSGDARLKVPSAPYGIETSTSSGDRDITLPADPSAAARLSARTTSGDIRISTT
ncbi:hypothetical protein SAVIM338S_04972 [Streptomyces avidinii]